MKTILFAITLALSLVLPLASDAQTASRMPGLIIQDSGIGYQAARPLSDYKVLYCKAVAQFGSGCIDLAQGVATTMYKVPTGKQFRMVGLDAWVATGSCGIHLGYTDDDTGLTLDEGTFPGTTFFFGGNNGQLTYVFALNSRRAFAVNNIIPADKFPLMNTNTNGCDVYLHIWGIEETI